MQRSDLLPWKRFGGGSSSTQASSEGAREDGSAVGLNRDVGYQTTGLFDEAGLPVLDSEGNQEIALAVQSFFLDEDFDSFGGNILATATL